jgi:hypothetical protein
MYRTCRDSYLGLKIEDYNARFVERMTLFAAELGQRQGYFPRMNWRLLGEPWAVGKADRVGHLIARE